MAHFTTDTPASILDRALTHARDILARVLVRTKSHPMNGQAILDARTRAEEARARVDRLLR